LEILNRDATPKCIFGKLTLWKCELVRGRSSTRVRGGKDEISNCKTKWLLNSSSYTHTLRLGYWHLFGWNFHKMLI